MKHTSTTSWKWNLLSRTIFRKSLGLFFVLLFLFTQTTFAQLCDPNTNSLRFNGSSYVSFPPNSSLNITTKITVEAWIKVLAFAPNYVQGSIVCKHGWSAGEAGYVLRAGGTGILAFAVAGIDDHGNAVGWKEVKSTSGALQLNKWQHVACTYDGSKLRLYVDGSQVATKNFKGTIVPSINYDLKIGRIADDSTFDKRFFNGLIDEVRIWKTNLSAATISSNMDIQISPTSTNLVAYWQHNDGTGTTVTDKCTGAIDGIRHNAQWDTDVPFTNGILRPVITLVGNSFLSSGLTGNQWNLNGVPIPGATGISFTPTLNGDYTVTVDYGLGCIATSIPYAILNTSIDETFSRPFTIVNTSSGVYNLVPNGQPISGLNIKVYDLNGKEIFRSNDPYAPIYLSGNGPGMYLLSLEFNGRKQLIKLIQN